MPIKLIEDMANQENKHDIKHVCWDLEGIEYIRLPLPVADYILVNDKVADVISRKQKRGIPVKKMDLLGTYKVAVDTKKDLQEIIGNICGKQHARFKDEICLAQNNGIKLIVLIENKDGIKEIRDLFRWQNPRMHRYNKILFMHRIGKWQNIPEPKSPPTSGQTLAKAMLTIQSKYGCEFIFCTPDESPKKIVEILTKEGIENGNLNTDN